MKQAQNITIDGEPLKIRRVADGIGYAQKGVMVAMRQTVEGGPDA